MIEGIKVGDDLGGNYPPSMVTQAENMIGERD
jgi:hypothetical protein